MRVSNVWSYERRTAVFTLHLRLGRKSHAVWAILFNSTTYTASRQGYAVVYRNTSFTAFLSRGYSHKQ